MALATLSAASLVGPGVSLGAEEVTPGVYTEELPSTTGIVAVDTGVPVLLGAGTPTTPGNRPAPVTGPIPISSVAEFDQVVVSPSAALGRAVTDFFDQGGVQAMVALIPSEDAATITGALDTVATWRGWDLLVVPALGALPSTEWFSTATAMAATAEQSRGVALLDPPADAVAAAPTDGGAALLALAQQLRATGEDAGAATMYSSSLYSSGLVDGSDESPVATAPAAAGIIAATDAAAGPWGQPAGPGHPIDGVTPGLTVDNTLAATFDEAGITPVMSLPGYGTVLMGTRTLSQQPDHEYLSTVRTVDFVATSIETGLQQYVFDPNDGETWSAVTAAVSQFLTTVWQEGGLMGDTAAAAFSAGIGLGSTMTAQDILNGYMLLEVTLMVEEPGQPTELTFTQLMQGA